jgi:hypothetical protein
VVRLFRIALEEAVFARENEKLRQRLFSAASFSSTDWPWCR